MIDLDEYSRLALTAKFRMDTEKKVPLGLDTAIKIHMDMIIEELLHVASDSNKDCLKYLNELLNSKTMEPIYNLIGEYKYKS